MFEDLTDEPKTEFVKTTTTTFNPKPYLTKKEDVPQTPYRPVALYVDRDFPPEVKDNIYKICSTLISKKVVIRVNGDDKEFVNKLLSLSDKCVEVYSPWKLFNDIETKFYYNTATAKQVACQHFPGWEKIPDAVKAMLARNVRMIFGDKNNSIALCLITWTKDGASKISEINKDTGKASFVIKVANFYGFPVLNLSKPNSESILEKTFSN